MVNNDRLPRFELHIQPLIRRTGSRKDDENTGLDLWDYATVRAHAPEIIARIKTDMPWTVHGGLWPKEWVATFERWVNNGFPRLELGVPVGPYEASRDGGKIVLVGEATVPDETYEAWLQPEIQSDGVRAFPSTIGCLQTRLPA